MSGSLVRWMDDYGGEIGSDDIVLIAQVENQSNEVLQAGEVLAGRGIEIRSTNVSSLLDACTIDFVGSSAARRVVLLAPFGCIDTETIGEFIAACERYGKDVAFRTIPNSEALFLSGTLLANGWWWLGWHGH